MADDHRHPERARDRSLPRTSRRTRSARSSTSSRGLPVDDAEPRAAAVREGRGRRRAEAARLGDRQRRAQPQLPADELFVARALGRRGPDPKWGQPRARGRYFRIRKRTSHITIVVARYDDDELERAAPARRVDAAAARRSPQRRRAERVRRSRQRARGRPTTTTTITITTTTTTTIDEVADEVEDAPRSTTSSRRRRASRGRGRSRRDDADETPTPRRRRRSRRRRGRSNGSESQPVRVPPRHHHRLEVAVVRRGRRSTRDFLIEDWKIRDYLRKQLERAAVSRVEIERTRDRLRIDVYTARPGIVIGRRGAEAERLRAGLRKISGNPKIQFNIQEIKQPELDATLHRAGRRRPAHRPRVVPAGDEARGADRDEGRRARRPRAVQRSPRRRRDEPQGVVPRRSGAAAHAARRHRLRPRRGEDHVRSHRREGLDLQGRDPPLQDRGRGQDRQGSRDGRRRDRGRHRVAASSARVAVAAVPRPTRRRRSTTPRSATRTPPRPTPLRQARPIPSSSASSPRKKRSSAAPASTTRRRTSTATRTDRC